MPIYEYRCRGCGGDFDVLRRAGDQAPPSCPACGASDAKRLVSLVAGLGARSGSGASPSGAGCGCGGACACGRSSG